MITVKLSSKHLYEIDAQGYIIPREHNFKSEDDITLKALKKYFPALEELLEQRAFTGTSGSTCAIPVTIADRLVYLIFVGLGSSKKAQQDRIEQYRRALGQAVRAAESLKITNLALEFPDSHWFNCDNTKLAQETVTTITMATYHFDDFITDPARKYPEDYTLTIVAPELLHEEIKVGVELGTRIGFAVNQARYWCDAPSSINTHRPC